MARSAAFHDTFEEPRPPPAPSAERWAGPLIQQQVPLQRVLAEALDSGCEGLGRGFLSGFRR